MAVNMEYFAINGDPIIHENCYISLLHQHPKKEQQCTFIFQEAIGIQIFPSNHVECTDIKAGPRSNTIPEIKS